MPLANIERITSPRPFLRGQRPGVDAVLKDEIPPAEHARRQPPAPWAMYVDEWVSMQRINGSVDRLFEHWIQGQGAEPTEPRWSVIRNVLGWVD